MRVECQKVLDRHQSLFDLYPDPTSFFEIAMAFREGIPSQIAVVLLAYQIRASCRRIVRGLDGKVLTIYGVPPPESMTP